MNILKVMEQMEEFIVGKKEESLLNKKKRTVGFVADGVKPKRKYTRRKKTTTKRKVKK
tara:strand:- start:121 stop:294 length:174 start_codon:yes stop_codon:yes gene_type:complete